MKTASKGEMNSQETPIKTGSATIDAPQQFGNKYAVPVLRGDDQIATAWAPTEELATARALTIASALDKWEGYPK